MQAALQHSVPLKRTELAVPALSIWGRITAGNGKDYIVAQCTPEPRMEDGKPRFDALYFVSQDGISWSDLPTVTDEQRDVASHMTTLLQGDLKKKHYWPPKVDEEEEELAAGMFRYYVGHCLQFWQLAECVHTSWRSAHTA